MRVCVGGGGGGGGGGGAWRVKIGISASMTAKEEVSQRSKYKKTEHSEIKQFGNNNNSIPKSKSIEKGEVLRWSLRKKKSSGTHCTDLILLC